MVDIYCKIIVLLQFYTDISLSEKCINIFYFEMFISTKAVIEALRRMFPVP